MKKMIWLHQDGEPVLVNPDKIETVHKGQNGSYVYFSGGDGALEVDEDQELVDCKFRDAYR